MIDLIIQVVAVTGLMYHGGQPQIVHKPGLPFPSGYRAGTIYVRSPWPLRQHLAHEICHWLQDTNNLPLDERQCYIVQRRLK